MGAWSAHNFQKACVYCQLRSCVKGQDECACCGASQLNSIIYWHIKVKLHMVLQNDVNLKALTFEKPSVKITLDLLTQRYWGNVDIYINTPHSDLLYCISYSIWPFIKTCILHICKLFQVDWIYGSWGEGFWRMKQIWTVQQNLSWRNLSSLLHTNCWECMSRKGRLLALVSFGTKVKKRLTFQSGIVWNCAWYFIMMSSCLTKQTFKFKTG